LQRRSAPRWRSVKQPRRNNGKRPSAQRLCLHHFPAVNEDMLTIDDIRAIPLFSTLPVAELERLAHTSADLHLCAGEFAVHEGGDRAL
jgi:hypothetical protein